MLDGQNLEDAVVARLRDAGVDAYRSTPLDALLTEADVLDSYLKGARPGDQELAVMVPVHVVARAVAALRSVQVPVTEALDDSRWEYGVKHDGYGHPLRRVAPKLTADGATHRRRVDTFPWEPLPSPGTTTEEE